MNRSDINLDNLDILNDDLKAVTGGAVPLWMVGVSALAATTVLADRYGTAIGEAAARGYLWAKRNPEVIEGATSLLTGGRSPRRRR